MKKKLLIICATHGDERIGLEVVTELEHKGLSGYFESTVANIEALDQNVRFVECDLNRSYPGDKNADFYEERRAAELLDIVKDYDYVIDMHEASSGTEDFIIIAKDRICKNFPVDLVNMGAVLLWPEPKGPLCGVVENAIELEFGMKDRNRKNVVEKATNIVKDFILKIYSLDKKDNSSPKKIYRVFGELLAKDCDECSSASLRDFVEIEIKGERFYPLLVGQYMNLGILCYKMKLVD